MTKYAVEISLVTVAIVGIGFISEAILCVEYIQGTRLALIKADKEIAAVFALFSISSICRFCRLLLQPTVLWSEGGGEIGGGVEGEEGK